MKTWAFFFLGALVVVSLVGAFLFGRVTARAGLTEGASAGEIEVGDRFWRVELSSGLRGRQRALLAPRTVGPQAPPPVAEQAAEAVRLIEREDEVQDELQLAVAKMTARLTGPLLEAWYENGQLHFRGIQSMDASGAWVRDGPWEAWHENGALHELGAYRGDVEHGPWKWWYENGTRMSEGTFDHGERVGPWMFWYETGHAMMEGRYVEGKGSGHWVYYHENGLRRAQGSFEDGELHGEWTVWHTDGAINHERTGRYHRGELARD